MWRKLSRPLLGLGGLAQCRRWASAMLLLPRRVAICNVMPFPVAAVGPPALLCLIWSLAAQDMLLLYLVGRG